MISFDDDVAQIYDAPLQMSAWTDAFDAVARTVDAAGSGQFHPFDPRENRMLVTCVPACIPPEGERYYNEQLAAGDPRRGLIEGKASGEWIYDQDYFDERFVSRAEVHQ